MKKFLNLVMLGVLAITASAQQTINYSILVDSEQREFILYVPASYNPNSSAPLVFSFHGLGGNAQLQMDDHDFRPVADTAGFIIAHPLGAPIIGQGIRGWNFGNDTLPDDVKFTSEMIDTIAADFNINPDRIYACGMSFGGFFSIYLAGQLSHRIASVASVAGTMINNVTDSAFVPNRPIALLEIHGTNDNNVSYDGSQISSSVQHVLDWFVGLNNCDTIPSITSLPDTDPNDGSTVEHMVYANGDDGTTVEHLKVTGGGHTWPDENTNTQGVNRDINGCIEIWKFFSKFDINGFIGSPVSIATVDGLSSLIVYPNPAEKEIIIQIENPKSEVKVYDHLGQDFTLPTVYSDETIRIDVQSVPSGIYYVSVANAQGVFTSNFIKH